MGLDLGFGLGFRVRIRFKVTIQLARFPRSWKIIENPGKINFPRKSWKID